MSFFFRFFAKQKMILHKKCAEYTPEMRDIAEMHGIAEMHVFAMA